MNTEPTNPEKRLILLTQREEITNAIGHISDTIAAQHHKVQSLVLMVEAIDAMLETIPQDSEPDALDEAVGESFVEGQN
jgi:hypothetical protein